jgi:erythromycin esterase-like protein
VEHAGEDPAAAAAEAGVMRRSVCAALFLPVACATAGRTSTVPQAELDAVRDELAAELLAEPSDRPIVAFGETTHGTAEFRALFYDTALLASRGEREVTIALERDPIYGYWLNEWIEGCGSIATDALTWHPPFSETDLDFVERARQHDLRGEGCIRVVGVDAAVHPHTALLLHPYLAACRGEGYGEEIRALVTALQRLAPTYGTEDAQAEDILAQLEARAAEEREGTHCNELDWWLHIVRQHIEIPPSAREGFPVPELVNSVDRDRLMADNVGFWAERGGMVLLLAHAGHVAKVRIPAVHGGGWSTPAGFHLAAAFPERYRTVALTFGQGTLSAMGCVIQRRETTRRIRSPRHASLQRDLLRDFAAPVVLPVEEACRDRECGVMREFLYCLPRGWSDPRISYYGTDVRQGFDWVVFLPHASAEQYAR